MMPVPPGLTIPPATDTPRPLVHIGYHKTATSWLQVRLFVPAHGFWQILDHDEVFDLLVRPHGLRFDPARAGEAIEARLRAVEPGAVPVISSELLSGHPFYGGRESDIYAERLARVLPRARILVTIRNQLQLLPSLYMQYLERGGTLPFARFFDGAETPGFFGFAPEHYEYDLLVARYQALFGSENVFVLPQEALRQDLDAAGACLARFAGAAAYAGLRGAARAPHAPSYPEGAQAVLRRANHVRQSVLNPAPFVSIGGPRLSAYRLVGALSRRWPFRARTARRHLVSDYVARRFAGRFAAHNTRLSEIVCHALDLSAYDRLAEPVDARDAG